MSTQGVAWSVLVHVAAAVTILSLGGPDNIEPPQLPVAHVTLIAPWRPRPVAVRRATKIAGSRPRPAPRIFQETVKRSVPSVPVALPAPLELAIEIAPVPPPQLPGLIAAPIRTGRFEETTRIEPPAPPRPRIKGSGFAVESPPAPGETPKTPVRLGTFGDASSTSAGTTSGVEILSKPRPLYTEEARSLGIQGEVLLEALFRASGECQVLRLVHSLGHGLDESAAEAARQIRFRPATRAGRAVDSTAIVHISFELAL